MKSRIPQIATKLDETVAEAAEEALEAVVAEAKARVPVGATGELQKSIHIEVGDEEVRVVAGNTKAWYGHIVEGGSAQGGGRPPRPFLVPAFEMHKKDVQKKISLAVKRLTETGRGES